MKSEAKAVLLAIRENIEMELFSSEEGCIVIQTQEEKVEYTSDQVSRNLWEILDFILLVLNYGYIPSEYKKI